MQMSIGKYKIFFFLFCACAETTHPRPGKPRPFPHGYTLHQSRRGYSSAADQTDQAGKSKIFAKNLEKVLQKLLTSKYNL